MRFDAATVREQLVEALPRRPYVGAVPGAEVEVGPAGELVEVFFDEDLYDRLSPAALGAAVVAAQHRARHAALADRHDALLGLA